MSGARDIVAHCAYCGLKPREGGSGDCRCETKALHKAIEAAERRWLDSWMARIHDWVTNASVRYITASFESMKQQRKYDYSTYVRSLPHYKEFREYHGRPPLHPTALQRLHAQLADAHHKLQAAVDADWKRCLAKYPEVLDYYYSCVNVGLPPGPVPPPGAVARHPPTSRGADPTLGFEDLNLGGAGKPSAHRRRNSIAGSYVVSGRPRVPVAPTPPPAPYGFGFPP